ncbi:FAD-binding oxidoreductase [Robbsia sp. KACC 23696]|uniref:FAD-binding oxidoreductase n=1 Tax=Robbsia sp. KACC 23696 TaxID=3149231 RepID=UPI00325C2A08
MNDLRTPSPAAAPHCAEPDAGFLSCLVDALGSDVVTTDPALLAPWQSDWRGLYRGDAQALVRPRTTAEVSTCLRLCNAAHVPVVPRGGNTGLCGGAAPESAAKAGAEGRPLSVILSLDRMNAVRSVDTIANVVTAEAGCILADLQRIAADAERLLPLSLAAEGSCQLGGNLSTNAGGVNVVRYGMTRELVLGVEAVLPNGEIFEGLRTLRKDNTGYDLKQLLIGAEGTLGIITAASLRLYPRNGVRTVVLAAVETPQQALDLYSLVFKRCGQRVQAFEYFTHPCLELVLREVEGVRAPFNEAHDGYVLLELADTADEGALIALVEEVVGQALEDGLCQDAAVSATLAQLAAFWRLREEISEAQKRDGAHLKHDVSVPIEALPAFLDAAGARLAQTVPDLRLFVFGHFGDGNLHYNVSRPAGAPTDFFTQAASHAGNDANASTSHTQGDLVTDAVLEEVARFNGSISAEHGIGQLKRSHFLQHKSALEQRLMRDIKKLFDPNGIMNPGKLL